MRNSHALRVGRKPPRRRAVSHHSREVPITERSGTASRKRTRIGAAHKSRFIFASRISRVQVSGLVLWQPGANSQSALRAAGPWSGSKPAHGSQRRNGGNGSPQAVPVFLFFLGGVRRPVAGVAGAALKSCCVCWWCCVAAVAVAQAPRRGAVPRQHSVAALALAERRPAQLPFWTQVEGAAKRSGAASRPGNEVFALLGRTGTRQCLVAVTGTPL